MTLEGAQKLLDFSQKLDINLLDNVIKTMYHGTGPQVCRTCSYSCFSKFIAEDFHSNYNYFPISISKFSRVIINVAMNPFSAKSSTRGFG